MRELAALDRGEDGRVCDFTFFVGAEKHPEFPFKKQTLVDTLRVKKKSDCYPMECKNKVIKNRVLFVFIYKLRVIANQTQKH